MEVLICKVAPSLPARLLSVVVLPARTRVDVGVLRCTWPEAVRGTVYLKGIPGEETSRLREADFREIGLYSMHM